MICISVINSFKEIAIGVFLLIVLAAFTAIAIADDNISALTKTVLGFVTVVYGIALMFVAFKAVK